MYRYRPPKPIVISLGGAKGFSIRQRAASLLPGFLTTTGAERGTEERQGYGLLAEMVIRGELGLPELKPEDHPVGYDILLPTRVKVDVKCRGGTKPFQELYEGADGTQREAKHNFFARQLHDPQLDADIFLLIHLRTPRDGALPGKPAERVWSLYVCGWVSKARVCRDGVYLPPGAISERGRTWFGYRNHEIEFYNKNLNGLQEIKDLDSITAGDVLVDSEKTGALNLTAVDAARIALDLAGRGLLDPQLIKRILPQLQVEPPVQPLLHSNQYVHLAKWLRAQDFIKQRVLDAILTEFPEQKFTGL